jgi:hypothetical protein
MLNLLIPTARVRECERIECSFQGISLLVIGVLFRARSDSAPNTMRHPGCPQTRHKQRIGAAREHSTHACERTQHENTARTPAKEHSTHACECNATGIPAGRRGGSTASEPSSAITKPASASSPRHFIVADDIQGWQTTAGGIADTGSAPQGRHRVHAGQARRECTAGHA